MVAIHFTVAILREKSGDTNPNNVLMATFLSKSDLLRRIPARSEGLGRDAEYFLEFPAEMGLVRKF